MYTQTEYHEAEELQATGRWFLAVLSLWICSKAGCFQMETVTVPKYKAAIHQRGWICADPL